MDEEQFEEILLFIYLFFFMIFMNEDKKKNRKSEPLGVVIFLKKGTKKEHRRSLYKKCNLEIMKCFSGNTINHIIIMHALSYNIERVGAEGITYFEVYVTSLVFRRCQ